MLDNDNGDVDGRPSSWVRLSTSVVKKSQGHILAYLTEVRCILYLLPVPGHKLKLVMKKNEDWKGAVNAKHSFAHTYCT